MDISKFSPEQIAKLSNLSPHQLNAIFGSDKKVERNESFLKELIKNPFIPTVHHYLLSHTISIDLFIGITKYFNQFKPTDNKETSFSKICNLYSDINIIYPSNKFKTVVLNPQYNHLIFDTPILFEDWSKDPINEKYDKIFGEYVKLDECKNVMIPNFVIYNEYLKMPKEKIDLIYNNFLTKPKLIDM